MAVEFDFNRKFTREVLQEFSDILENMQHQINFKVSSRGWCYLMEQAGFINKSQFGKVDMAINRCRKEGYLPVDFVAEEDARAFQGVIKPSEGDVSDTLDWMLRDVLNGAKYFLPDYWEDEEYYIQVVVEKIDLKTLFAPVCAKYKIPIANAKGWSSILQRAEYARRFKEAEDMGLKCVLLYCGDHDPDGLRISDTMRKNLRDIKDIEWADGFSGYDPVNLQIERFGLNYDFIKKNNYTWIDNLITGSGMNLASQTHKNNRLPYVQDYLSRIGERKCEANAIVTTPAVAKALMQGEIERWLGADSLDRFAKKDTIVKVAYHKVLQETGLMQPIKTFLGQDEAGSYESDDYNNDDED